MRQRVVAGLGGVRRGKFARLGVGLAASLVLAACEGELSRLGEMIESAGGGFRTGPQAANAIVVRRDLRLEAISGFCVDPVSTRNGATQAFVVFGNCAAIAKNAADPQPIVNAIVTATATPSGNAGEGAIAPQLQSLMAFFEGDGGRQALSRSGTAETVTVLESFTDGQTIYLRVRDESPPAFAGAQERYWRAYFDAESSVIAMSIFGTEASPVTKSDGLHLLQAFVERNQRGPDPVKAALRDAGAKPAPPGLLNRIFR